MSFLVNTEFQSLSLHYFKIAINIACIYIYLNQPYFFFGVPPYAVCNFKKKKVLKWEINLLRLLKSSIEPLQLCNACRFPDDFSVPSVAPHETISDPQPLACTQIQQKFWGKIIAIENRFTSPHVFPPWFLSFTIPDCSCSSLRLFLFYFPPSYPQLEV